MAKRVADRLKAARQNLFVGRDSEKETFCSALAHQKATAQWPHQFLHVHGPGGIGKSSLLHEFAGLCTAEDIHHIFVDARHFEPTPAALDSTQTEIETFIKNTPDSGAVLFVDSYEVMEPVESWLHEQFFPQLPESIFVVLASRGPLSAHRKMDSGWQSLTLDMPLQNLDKGESGTYLLKREVPQDQHGSILEFTHGHPLALSLVADLYAQSLTLGKNDWRFRPESATDTIRVLLGHLIDVAPSSRHRQALEASAVVRQVTENLLGHLLKSDTRPEAVPVARPQNTQPVVNLHDLFAWLRSLSFMETGTTGLMPHDLVREILAADLRWRDSDRLRVLHQRARQWYSERLPRAQGVEGHQLLFDYIFLQRSHPAISPFLDWQASGSYVPDTAREADWPALLAMVERHEGVESANIAAHWFVRQPQGVFVIREANSAEGKVAGFYVVVALQLTTAEDRKIDPAIGTIQDYLKTHSPLRAGENSTLFRFWMSEQDYQDVSEVQSLISVGILRHCLMTQGLAWSFLPCAHPDFWAEFFQFAGIARLPETDFEVGKHSYGVYSHDWRAITPMAWLQHMAESETESQSDSSVGETKALRILSQSEFTHAVAEALRAMARPPAQQKASLSENALLHSRVVAQYAEHLLRSASLTNTGNGAAETTSSHHLANRTSALLHLLREASETLRESPRLAKFYQALYHTYIHPAPSQEQAADLLNVPFSTYRRHLKSGVEHVTELLWQREVSM